MSICKGGAGAGCNIKASVEQWFARSFGNHGTAFYPIFPGDSGAVGRVHVSKKRGMVLDLKVGWVRRHTPTQRDVSPHLLHGFI